MNQENETPVLEEAQSEEIQEDPQISYEERMEAIRARIPEEPKSVDDEGRSHVDGEIVRIRVIYPNGTKLQRNFLSRDLVSLLYQLVELDIIDHGMNIPSFQLCATASKDCIESVGIGGEFEK